MKLKILDNVLSDSVLTSIQEKIESQEMPWYFIENSARSWDAELIKRAPLNYSFNHIVLNWKLTSPTSGVFEVLSSMHDWTYSMSLILKDLFEVEKTYSIFRLRWGMTTTIDKPHTHTPHTDMHTKSADGTDVYVPHKVILFYLNDSDGDTYFYDKEHKIVDSVTPKGNRAVLFDGATLHSSSKPIEFARRIVLNINLVDEEKLKILLQKI